MITKYVFWFFPAITAIVSICYAHRGKGRTPVKLTVTGSVLLLLVGYALYAGTAGEVLFVWGLAFALGASMVGDFFLSRGDDTFIHGVIGFFFAHAGYLSAFLVLGGFNLPILAVFSLALLLYLLLVLRPKIEDPLLFWAVCGYTAISALVIGAAFGTRQPLFIVGALLIALSDCIIAWNKFVRPVRYDELSILSTYYIAQISIGIGSWFLLSS